LFLFKKWNTKGGPKKKNPKKKPPILIIAKVKGLAKFFNFFAIFFFHFYNFFLIFPKIGIKMGKKKTQNFSRGFPLGKRPFKKKAWGVPKPPPKPGLGGGGGGKGGPFF